jgi:hypothetical protein
MYIDKCHIDLVKQTRNNYVVHTLVIIENENLFVFLFNDYELICFTHLL